VNEAEKKGYGECIDRMAKAAREWLAAHPCAHLAFTDIVAEVAAEQGLPMGEKIAIICDLRSLIPRWACNEDTRAFLYAMEDASRAEATFLQAQAIVEHLLSFMQRRTALNHLALGGEHRCPWCSHTVDTAVEYGGNDQLPDGPMLTVCIECTGPYWFERGHPPRCISPEEQAALPDETRRDLTATRKALSLAKQEVAT